MNQVRVQFGEKILRELDELIGVYGSSRSEVVRTLISFWILENCDSIG